MNVAEMRAKANAGSTVAQTLLGTALLYGDDEVAVDYAEAFRLLTLASDRGASRATVNLAYMYEMGLGTRQDLWTAVQLYERVGRNEFAAAIALGRLYSDQNTTLANVGKAWKWYFVATCFENLVESCADDLGEARRFVSTHSFTPIWDEERNPT